MRCTPRRYVLAFIVSVLLVVATRSRKKQEHCGQFAILQAGRVLRVETYLTRCESAERVGRPPTRLFSIYRSPDERGGGRHEPLLVADVRKITDVRPDTTLIISVHNSEQSLSANLPSTFATTTGNWELIVVLDACYDRSYDVVIRNVRLWFNSSSCLRVRIINQPTAVWEVSSDNIGLRSSSPSEAYVLLQADNIMLEKGWNERMIRVLRERDDVFAISARCGHSFDETNKVGRCGADIGVPLPADVDKTRFHVRETVNRGPLMLRSVIAQRLGFLDEEAHLLEDDDHDLMARARKLGYKVGYMPVEMFAPMDLSPRRNPTFKEHTPIEVREEEKRYRSYRIARAKNFVSELQVVKQNKISKSNGYLNSK